MNFRKLLMASVAAFALATPAIAQQGAFPNYPIVGGASYCASTTNNVCTSTIPAGPTVMTGNEQLPANTELPSGRSPQNVLVTPASLNALPITFVTVTTAGNPSGVSASSVSGGVYYRYDTSAAITAANITLPPLPIDGQQFIVSSNRSITTLSITAASTENMGANSAPTAMTASTTATQGYRFIYNLAADSWYKVN